MVAVMNFTDFVVYTGVEQKYVRCSKVVLLAYRCAPGYRDITVGARGWVLS